MQQWQQPYQPPAVLVEYRLTATDYIVPLVLSIFCVGGGFVWGLVKMATGNNKAGWAAVAINAGVWALGALAFFGLMALGFAASAAGAASTH